MLSIVRGGPRVLLLSGEGEWLRSVLRVHCPAVEEMTPEQAFERADDRHTVVAFQEGEEGVADKALFLPTMADEVLAALVNKRPGEKLRSVRLLPRIILFRVFGNANRVMEQITEDYHGRRVVVQDVLPPSMGDSVAVFFTTMPLNRRVPRSSVKDEALYIQGLPYGELIESLSGRALWYFTEGLEEHQWNEMDIRIYDSWGFYMENYARVRTVLDGLETGFILSEGWGKDYAHILMAVRVYRLRFFSFLPPQIIKELLMGLEYAEDGSRLADIDLYSGKNKISWGGLKEKRANRQDLGILFRGKLLSRLHEGDRDRFVEQERVLLEKRPSGEEGA